MTKKPAKMPEDANQRAKCVVDLATGEAQLPKERQGGKNPAAVSLGKLGGLKGGKARAERLTPERRKAIGRIAAAARWGFTPKQLTELIIARKAQLMQLIALERARREDSEYYVRQSANRLWKLEARLDEVNRMLNATGGKPTGKQP